MMAKPKDVKRCSGLDIPSDATIVCLGPDERRIQCSICTRSFLTAVTGGKLCMDCWLDRKTQEYEWDSEGAAYE